MLLDRAIANSDPVQVHHRATRLNELEAALAELGIAVSFSQDLFDPADVDEVEMRVAGRGCYDVDALLERAGRSAQRAARLVAHDLQQG